MLTNGYLTCILNYTMNYTVVTTKLDFETKQAAQKTAEELGVPLSILVKGFLKQLIRTKTVTFSVRDEIPSKRLINLMKSATEDRMKGNASPVFDNAQDAIDWLHR